MEFIVASGISVQDTHICTLKFVGHLEVADPANVPNRIVVGLSQLCQILADLLLDA